MLDESMNVSQIAEEIVLEVKIGGSLCCSNLSLRSCGIWTWQRAKSGP